MSAVVERGSCAVSTPGMERCSAGVGRAGDAVWCRWLSASIATWASDMDTVHRGVYIQFVYVMVGL